MQDELTLLVRARALDEAALADIHRTYYRPIFRYISFRVGDPKVVEDLTSEVFTRLLSALRDKTAPQNTLRGWLFRVASHVVADHYRQRQRAPEVELTDMIPDDRTPLEDTISQKLRVQDLRHALKDLTDEQQSVLALRFGFGMRIREVAETIGKSEGAVKQLQLRALASLAKQLAPGANVS
ncbi:MAG: sigma-70 family RNA polymerase sigma factor [Anaerolineales bacterium]|nr:sigma-70 family RNA polymerase sigma factor [Anaerolineales bacterium]